MQRRIPVRKKNRERNRIMLKTEETMPYSNITKEELEALIAWFGNLPDCPKEIQVDKATYIPNLAETIDRLAGQARICYENPKMQGCILLMERIKEAIEKKV